MDSLFHAFGVGGGQRAGHEKDAAARPESAAQPSVLPSVSAISASPLSAGGSGNQRGVANRVFVFDRAMVLPEFIVSFDYVVDMKSASATKDDKTTANEPVAAEDLEPDLARSVAGFSGLKEPLFDFVAALAEQTVQFFGAVQCKTNVAQADLDFTTSALNTAPIVPARCAVFPPLSLFSKSRLVFVGLAVRYWPRLVP